MSQRFRVPSSIPSNKQRGGLQESVMKSDTLICHVGVHMDKTLYT